MLRDLSENPVAALAGLVDIAGLQLKTEPLGGRVRLVNGEVAPPDTPVVPKVMVGVVLIDSKRQFGFPFHAFQCLVTGLKKRRFWAEAAVWDTDDTQWSGLSNACKDIC